MSTEEEDPNVEETTTQSQCGAECGQGLPGGLCENKCMLSPGHGGPHNCGKYHS